MNSVISRIIELIRGTEAALEREMPGTARFQQLAAKMGQKFPWWNYERCYRPLPWYQMVSREEALAHCPNCGSAQQLGPMDKFPQTYTCGACGFDGPHPLYVES